MQRFLFFILFSVFIICCSRNNGKVLADKANVVTEQIRRNADKQKKFNDSVRIVGNLILNGGRIWGKNENYIFSLMDSLVSNKKESRLFYFKVFSKICNQADGDVAEAIGLYVLKYFEFDPQEFIENSKLIPDSTFESMGYQAGFEVYMSTNKGYEKKLQRIITTARNKTKTMSISNKRKLELFFKQMNEGIKQD